MSSLAYSKVCGGQQINLLDCRECFALSSQWREPKVLGGPADPAVGELPATGPVQTSTRLMELNGKAERSPAGGKMNICGRKSLLLLFRELQAYLFEPPAIFLSPLHVPVSPAFISLKASPTFRLTSGDARIISDLFLCRFLAWLFLGHAWQLFGGLLLE